MPDWDDWRNQQTSAYSNDYAYQPYAQGHPTTPSYPGSYDPHRSESTHGAPLPSQQEFFTSHQYSPWSHPRNVPPSHRTDQPVGPRGYASLASPKLHGEFFHRRQQPQAVPPPPAFNAPPPQAPPPYGSSAGARSFASGHPTPLRSGSGIFLGAQSTLHPSPSRSYNSGPPPAQTQTRPPQPRAPAPWFPPTRSQSPEASSVPPQPSAAAGGDRTARKGINVAGVNLPPLKAPIAPQETLNLASPSPSPERSPRSRIRTLKDDDPEIVYQSSARAPRQSDSSMTTIGVGDPTGPHYPRSKPKATASGAGWQTHNFYEDDDQPGPSLPSAHKNTKTYSGKSSAYKPPRPITSSNFHGPASSSSSRGRNARVIQQNADPIPTEIAGRKALERQVRERAKQTKQTKKQPDVKGKGKAKAPPTVIEIDSDSDEGGLEALRHRHEDANDPIESDDDDDDRRPSTSTAGPAKKASRGGARNSTASDRFHDSPSSPDPLSMNNTRSSEHRNKNAAASTSTSAIRKASLLADSQPGVPVQQRVADIERNHQARNGPRKTVVESLGRRTGFTRSGSPTDNAELQYPQNSSRVPRAAQKAMAAGRHQIQEAETKVYEVEAKPYLLAKVGLADTPGATCRVILTTSGDRSLDKLTLRTSRDGHDDGVEIKAGDAQEISYWPGSEQDDLGAYIYIRVRTEKLFTALIDMGPEPISTPGEKSVTIVLRNRSSLTDAWKEDPTTPEDQLFHSVVVGWPSKKKVSAVQASGMKAKSTMEIYSRIADAIHELERGRPGKSTKAKAKIAPDPKQTKLSFGKLRQDAQGDLTELTPPASRAGRADRDDSPNLDIEVQSRSATRRSSRPSTSEFANVSRPPDSTSSAAAWVPVLTEEEKRYQQWLKENDAKYRPDEVVVEFPPGQPGAITLPWGDVKRLQPDEFLNDTLIEFGLKQILKSIEENDASLPDDKKIAPHVHIFNSFFYKQLSTPKKKGVDPYKLVEKWTKKVNLFEKRFIVVPINEHFHWYLAMIINPAALLRPPPPPTAAPPPRQSGRIQQRDSTVDTEDAPDAPEAGKAEVASHHFSKGRVPKALREQQNLQAAPLVAGSEKAESDVDMLDESQAVSPVDRDEQEQEERIARGIEAEMVDKGDPLAASPSRADAEHAAAGALYSIYNSPPAQPEPAQMQIDSTPVGTSAHDGPSDMMFDEDMSDMDKFLPQRGSLEGGGPSSHAPGTPSHTRWRKGADEGSPTRGSGSPEVAFVHPTRSQPREPIGQEEDVVMPTPSQHKNDALAESLFGADADAAIANPADHPPVTGSQTGKDDDDDVLVVTPVKPAASTSATAHHEGRPASAAKSTSSTRRMGPQPLVPQDPEPDRAEQLQREREEEECRQRERENAERVAREERQKQALLEAKEAVDLEGCWILTFDSLGGYHKAVTNKLKSYLVSEAMSKLGKQPEELSIDQVQCGRADVPQQPNYCDCGLYLLHFVEHFLRNSDLLLNVIALNQPSVVKGGKKTQQAIADAEAFRNDSWAYEEAKSRRARMRDEVKVLVEQYAEGAEERHHREEQEREQRRLKKEEANRRRQEEMNREIVRRAAEQLAAAESTTPAPEATAVGASAPSVSAPAPGAVDAPAAPLSFMIRGAAGLKSAPAEPKVHGLSIKGAATANNNHQSSKTVLELSDEYSSTQGSPQKSIYALDQPNAAAWQPEPVIASPAVGHPVAATDPSHFQFPRAPPVAESMAERIIAFSDEDGDLRGLTNGVGDDDNDAGARGSPPQAPQTAEGSLHGRGRAATGELESSAAADENAESADSSEGMDDFAEPPRRKADHGRAEMVQPAAATAAVSAETAAPAEPPLDVGTEGSPELAVPAANQQQQQHQEQQQQQQVVVPVPSATPGRQKRVTRSSTRGSSPAGSGMVVRGANGGGPSASSERPAKRVKQSGGGGGDGGTSATVSASSSKATSRASSPGRADKTPADQEQDADSEAEAEAPSLAKNVGKKLRGRAPTKGRGRGRAKKETDTTEEITIDSE